MLTLMHHNANVHSHPFSSLEVLLAEPFPHTPQEMLPLEQRLSTAAAQTAAQMVLVQLTRAHEAEAFVTQAIAHARAQSPAGKPHGHMAFYPLPTRARRARCHSSTRASA
jgi:hypothetical protein